ncbi:hypothetical protein [Chloracidobacterium aggregatum]|jgi:hypothetical protein|uniref:Uncharacterized protein n=1 Tax=Chloracidobacterium sp. N TaxID=2821540 RepID=A0ABX8B254_9BACT|nr:hypothetical protein [Chloracidobacterium aggregatum]QUV85149.1 hypothetical protein J8C03_02380 [Chloracidobacterium sp. 2]QUV88453.1 hypothetical protein J8C07_03765 [Chloracidobacterium sp. S]QUV91372.1 hypothetical protein J8C04_02900 [Chloracidobacterium sp. A]QUV94548.1 hypothetical protein J8C05_03635 [Chloracidobacterium sp. N]QUV97751.1 hypothetical protein J8C00_04710 [Chloracidobacterium sp. E]
MLSITPALTSFSGPPIYRIGTVTGSIRSIGPICPIRSIRTVLPIRPIGPRQFITVRRTLPFPHHFLPFIPPKTLHNYHHTPCLRTHEPGRLCLKQVNVM